VRWFTTMRVMPMPNLSRKTKKVPAKAQPTTLRSWQQISEFLSQPTSVAERWAKEGMPVKRQGRFVTATPDESNKWLGGEAGDEPLHLATPGVDLSAELKRGLVFVRKERAGRNRK
jgi:hypothetical protein